MKRLIALILTIILAAGLGINVSAANASPSNYEYVLPGSYKNIMIRSADKVLYVENNNNKAALFDYNGKMLAGWFDELKELGGGTWLATDGGNHFTISSDGKRLGFSTKKCIEGFGFADRVIVTRDGEDAVYFDWTEYTGNVYFYDFNGRLLTQIPYAGLEEKEKLSYDSGIDIFDGLFTYTGPTGLFGAMDVHGNVVIKPKYEKLYGFDNGYAIAKNNGKYGIINKTEAVAVNFIYDDFTTWVDAINYAKHDKHIYIVTKDGHQSMMDPDTFAVTPMPELNGLEIKHCYISNRLFYVSDPAKPDIYGVISFDGKIILPVANTYIGAPSDGVIAVKNSDGKYGYIDLQGNKLIDFKYNAASSFSEGLACVAMATTDKTGRTYEACFIDKSGNVVFKLNKNDLSSGFNGDFASAGSSGSFRNNYYIDKTGKIVMSAEADTSWSYTGAFTDGLAIVCTTVYPMYAPSLDYRVIKYTGGTPSDWAANDVAGAISLGLVPDTLQKYYGTYITREDFCKLAFSLLKKEGVSLMSPTQDKPMKFKDTNSDTIYTLNQLGIINGVSDTSFAPDAAITREEAATILTNMAAYLRITMPPAQKFFDDEKSISSWAFEAVYKMYALEIMAGVGNGNFSPKTYYTVEQAITTMFRMYHTINK